MKRSAIQSPRKRYLITLPDEPKPQIGGTAAQLALFVVAVNIGACLLAAHVMTTSETAAPHSPIVVEKYEQSTQPTSEPSPAGRLAKMLFSR